MRNSQQPIRSGMLNLNLYYNVSEQVMVITKGLDDELQQTFDAPLVVMLPKAYIMFLFC